MQNKYSLSFPEHIHVVHGSGHLTGLRHAVHFFHGLLHALELFEEFVYLANWTSGASCNPLPAGSVQQGWIA